MDNYLISSSVGYGKTKLTSFDQALLNSGVANYNLIRVSSILPAKCCLSDEINISEGSQLNTAYASISSNVLNQVVSAAIAIGIPQDNNNIGVIMEYAAQCDKDEAVKTVKEMVEEAMNNRGYEIKEIKSDSSTAKLNKDGFVTAFACVAMW